MSNPYHPTQAATRDAVEELVETLVGLFPPKLGDGIEVSKWAKTVVKAIGLEHDPDDVNTAGERIVRIRTELSFPLPAVIRGEIARAKELREHRAEYEVFKRTVQWLDMTAPVLDRTHYSMIVATVEERNALQKILDQLDHEERYEEAAELFFGKWHELGKPLDRLPAKYRITAKRHEAEPDKIAVRETATDRPSV